MFGFPTPQGLLRAPSSLTAEQWELTTRFGGVATGNPLPLTLRVEKETAPGSGVWGAFATATITSAVWSEVDLGTYEEDGSYRARYERAGLVSDWATVSTPDPALGFPSAPSVNYNGIPVNPYVDATPSEAFTLMTIQLRDSGGVVTDEIGVVSAGTYRLTSGGTSATSGRARHERFSGTGSWASAWAEDSTSP